MIILYILNIYLLWQKMLKVNTSEILCHLLGIKEIAESILGYLDTQTHLMISNDLIALAKLIC